MGVAETSWPNGLQDWPRRALPLARGARPYDPGSGPPPAPRSGELSLASAHCSRSWTCRPARSPPWPCGPTAPALRGESRLRPRR
eukprot:2546384-Lingulodinium_polyedra.AAC.1